MTDRQSGDFKEKLFRDIRECKKNKLTEESISVLLSICFAMNVACLVVFPFTVISILNIVAVYIVAKKFRGTVKRQIKHSETLRVLKALVNKKVWTKND